MASWSWKHFTIGYCSSRREGYIAYISSYRFHPSIQRVKAILESKELGKIKSISAALTAPAGAIADGDIRWEYKLGGGSTMDPGGTYSSQC